MEHQIIKMSAFKIAGFGIKTSTKDEEDNKAIPKFWGEYITDGRMEKLHNEPFRKKHTEYGVCFRENSETGEFEYFIGVEIKDGFDIPKDYNIREIPEALFAVFTTPPADESNLVSAIQKTWKYIYSEWFSNSGYEFDCNSVDFELYDERCMSETGKVCDIYIPVKKKTV
jgi:AraC family transcriptional regulator